MEKRSVSCHDYDRFKMLSFTSNQCRHAGNVGMDLHILSKPALSGCQRYSLSLDLLWLWGSSLHSKEWNSCKLAIKVHNTDFVETLHQFVLKEFGGVYLTSRVEQWFSRFSESRIEKKKHQCCFVKVGASSAVPEAQAVVQHSNYSLQFNSCLFTY
jgi:hypothetical protein